MGGGASKENKKAAAEAESKSKPTQEASAAGPVDGSADSQGSADKQTLDAQLAEKRAKHAEAKTKRVEVKKQTAEAKARLKEIKSRGEAGEDVNDELSQEEARVAELLEREEELTDQETNAKAAVDEITKEMVISEPSVEHAAEPETETEPEPEQKMEPEPEPELSEEDIRLNNLATELKLSRTVIDPLHERFVELADENGNLSKKDMTAAIPALAQSPFFAAVFGLLRNGAGDAGSVQNADALAQESEPVDEKAFIAALAKFSKDSPLDAKLQAMFALFRGANVGGDMAVASGPNVGDLSRTDLFNLVNTVYATETEVMVEVLTNGLMKALDPDGTGKVQWDDFRQACEDIDDIDAMLTINFPK